MAKEKTQTLSPDAEDLDLGTEQTEKDRQDSLVTLWTKRFARAERYRKPIDNKNMRMYKLYKAYRTAQNYAYGTNLMPPIGFEIIETVKPRLSSANIKVNILPTKKEDINNQAINSWEDLVEYNLQEAGFKDLKIDWIHAMLLYANGTIQFMWNGRGVDLEVVDNWLLYVDPQAGKRMKNSRWEIKQSFKTKAVLEKNEKERIKNEEEPLYSTTKGKDKEGNVISEPLIKSKVWKDIEDEQSRSDDPRRDRQRLNTLKMGQIDDGTKKGSATGEPDTGGEDKDEGDRNIEILECFDHVTGKLQVIFNRKVVARDEENPYININKGRTFIDLPDISVPWEYYAIGHLEPVETTIHEIADSRNQAMDDIVFSLDPIRKLKKGKGYKKEDFKHSPGAIWELDKADDIVFEKLPETSRAWVEKDNMLRREVQTSLALSEYTQGSPKSSQEPASKVEILLAQSNIRFSILVRQMEISMTELTNAIIQMNQEWLDEEMSMRILGNNFRFSEFKASDKEVIVDAQVDIEPDKEKSIEQQTEEVMKMYEMFVIEDKPEGGSEEEIMQWKNKKNTLQRLIVDKLGYEEYADILAPKEVAKPKEEKVAEAPPGNVQARPPESLAIPQPIAMLEPEVETGEPQGLLQSLLGGGN